MPVRPLRAAAWAATALWAGGAALAQDCPATDTFERDGTTIRSARAATPLAFLPWVRANLDEADRRLATLAGRPYRKAEVKALRDELERLPLGTLDVEQRVALRFSEVVGRNCADGQVDLEFYVFTPRIAPVLGGTWEATLGETAAPEKQAGADRLPGRLRVQPRLGYDAAERLSAALRATWLPPGSARPGTLWDALTLDASSAARAQAVSLALAGSRDSEEGLLAHTAWRLDAAAASEPAQGVDRLRQQRWSAGAQALTRPLGRWALPLRFGALAERGRLGSAGTGGTAGALDGDGYTALKLVAGTTTRLDRQSFSASWGVEAGARGDGSGGADWVRQVVDLAHDVAWPVGDHRRLRLESRLNAGALRLFGPAPVGVRFFGGGREQPFLPGDDWQIRANPVIRSFGANALAATADGAGGRRFVALNLTASVPLKRTPLIPAELTAQGSEFRDGLQSALGTATEALQDGYAAKDPRFAAAVARLPAALAALDALGAAVDAAAAAHPGQAAAEVKACEAALSGAARRVKAAQKARGLSQLSELLPGEESEDRLGQVRSRCTASLADSLEAPALAAQRAPLQALQDAIAADYAAVDTDAARRDAEREMAYVKRVVTTLVDEVNLEALSPLLMLDVARLGPAGSGPATRVGLGAGLRWTLVDSVDFSLGWMANLRRQSGEPRGALFLALQFKDLF